MKLITAITAITAMILSSIVSMACAADVAVRTPAPGDKCPVCGMFVAKFPDFTAQVHFKDKTVLHFDGTKDMFRYYQSIFRYSPDKTVKDTTAVFVTSYYSLKPINALTAWYVSGSNVYGPMGRELIPFAKESEAREFKKDHKGKLVLRFNEITASVIKGLE